MDFSQVAAEGRQLKAQYDAGALSEADFKARLQDLMVQDDGGHWWMIGAETGQWYVHDGEQWVRAEPTTTPRSPDKSPVVSALPRSAEPQTSPASKTEKQVTASSRPGCRKMSLRLAVTFGALLVVAGIGAWGLSKGMPDLLYALRRGPSPSPTFPISASPSPTSLPAAGGEIKLAILAPLSGAVPTFGVMTRDGALLAIEEWNAKGGVLGKKIVPILEDSQCTPDPAVNAANKVIDQDKVSFIIGEVCSKASIPISEIANAKKVIQISPTSTNPDVTVNKDGTTKVYVFRACFIDRFQGTVGAKFAVETLKAKTTFVMQDQANNYVKGLAEAFEKSFTEAGGTIVGKESYTAMDTDFSAILAKVAEAKPGVVYLPDYYNIVNLVTKQAKEKGITATFLGGDGWDSSDLDVKASAGGYFTNHYSKDSTAPEAIAFLKNFGAKYKDDNGQPAAPDALAALAYDATNLLLTAIKNASSDDTDKVKAALEAISFQGASGKITFDKQHNPVKSGVILQVTETGVKFKALVTP